jgi:hypothetical protein
MGNVQVPVATASSSQRPRSVERSKTRGVPTSSVMGARPEERRPLSKATRRPPRPTRGEVGHGAARSLGARPPVRFAATRRFPPPAQASARGVSPAEASSARAAPYQSLQSAPQGGEVAADAPPGYARLGASSMAAASNGATPRDRPLAHDPRCKTSTIQERPRAQAQAQAGVVRVTPPPRCLRSTRPPQRHASATICPKRDR